MGDGGRISPDQCCFYLFIGRDGIQDRLLTGKFCTVL